MGTSEREHVLWRMFARFAFGGWLFSGLVHQASGGVWVWTTVGLAVVVFCLLNVERES